MTGFLHEREFSRKNFLKGSGAVVVGASVVGAGLTGKASAGRPSSVVIAFPLTAATGVTHERISFPSNNTEHAPH